MAAPSRTALLQTLRLKGRASADAIASALAADSETVTTGLSELADAGLAELGPREAYKLMPAGRDALAELLTIERAGVDQGAVKVHYDSFCEHNDAFKEVMTAWQLKDPSTPNDHADAAYDDGVVARLGEIHQAVLPVVTAAVAPVGRLAASYPRRLETAWQVVAGGDRSWIAKPLADSYHTVWFELHEELIGLAGLTRAEEAAAGRGA
jgi:pyruvate,orthophosphate dikinase